MALRSARSRSSASAWGQTVSPSASYLIKPQVTKGLVLLVGPFLRQGSFTPVPLRGPAAIRHPWRGAVLAASMPLGPRSETCVQPAPKSRFASSGISAYEDQDQLQINSFPAKAGPTKPRSRNTDRSHAPRGNAAPDAPRPADDAHSGRGSDAERHGMHSHAERGNDQISLTRRAQRRTGFSREAFDLLLICFRF